MGAVAFLNEKKVYKKARLGKVTCLLEKEYYPRGETLNLGFCQLKTEGDCLS